MILGIKLVFRKNDKKYTRLMPYFLTESTLGDICGTIKDEADEICCDGYELVDAYILCRGETVCPLI